VCCNKQGGQLQVDEPRALRNTTGHIQQVINTIRCTAVGNHKLVTVDVYAGKQAHHKA
jgi:hypothetical protein